MMRLFALFALVASGAQAFAPLTVMVVRDITTTTQLHMDRRGLLRTLVGGGTLVAAGFPESAQAKAASTFFWDEHIEEVKEEAQMPTGDKLDLNAAFVGEYKNFPGMFPHAAGKIASHGPYQSVRDIYDIAGLTDNDVKMFKKYDKYFTVNPPGRAFSERINARVST